jgi:PTS system N-acetylglucosamine-specific IIC component
MNSENLLAALGGSNNVKAIQARSSRLLLEVGTVDAFDDKALLGLGVRGLVRIAPTIAHVILGPIAELMARDMKRCLGHH